MPSGTRIQSPFGPCGTSIQLRVWRVRHLSGVHSRSVGHLSGSQRVGRSAPRMHGPFGAPLPSTSLLPPGPPGAGTGPSCRQKSCVSPHSRNSEKSNPGEAARSEHRKRSFPTVQPRCTTLHGAGWGEGDLNLALENLKIRNFRTLLEKLLPM